MNVNLQYDIDFAGGIYYEDQLQFNNYQVSLQLTTCTDNSREINIAMDRIKAWIYVELANTVFINQADAERAEMLQMLGVNITTLPEEPIDQIIAMMLYCKLNAITEGKLIIERLDLCSSLGDDVWYVITQEDNFGVLFQDGWWHRATTQHNNLDHEEVDKNVVKVQRTGWNDYGLAWNDVDSTQSGNVVVYANFSKNEN
jgi:hypothetical protein